MTNNFKPLSDEELAELAGPEPAAGSPDDPAYGLIQDMGGASLFQAEADELLEEYDETPEEPQNPAQK